MPIAAISREWPPKPGDDDYEDYLAGKVVGATGGDTGGKKKLAIFGGLAALAGILAAMRSRQS